MKHSIRGRRIGIIAGTVGLAISLAAACSSTPDQPDEIRATRNRAAQFAGYGNAAYDRGEIQQAREFYELALSLNQSVDEQPGVADMHNSIGKTYQILGELEEAERRYIEAQQIADRIGSDRILGQSLNNRGELQLYRDDPEGAGRLFEEALELFPGADLRAERAVVLHNLGSSLATLGRLDQARLRFQEASGINDRLGRRRELAANYFMLASVSSRSGDYAAALEWASSALELDRRMENPRGIAADLYALGVISQRMENLSQAHDYLTRSIAVSESIGSLAGMQRGLESLVEVAHALGRDEEADRHAEQLQQLRDRTSGAYDAQ